MFWTLFRGFAPKHSYSPMTDQENLLQVHGNLRVVLVTGGAGFIGSHTVLVLLEQGYQVVVLDNLSNGRVEALSRIEQLVGRQPTFVKGDVRDRALVTSIITKYKISAVLHFAGVKAVADSFNNPLHYYSVNVEGALTLLKAMVDNGVKGLIFSSSATVYGEEASIPYREDSARGTPTSPYGKSKVTVEEILQDLAHADPTWQICCLRYFNPIGAHHSGLIGEDPEGIPNNLLPYISQVACGRRSILNIFGDDYETPDGTCRRDYLHVMDLAEGHVAALENLSAGFDSFNLGTGYPVSVREMIAAYEDVSGQAIAFQIEPRRAGDLPEFWSDCSKAKEQLSWQANRPLNEMVADAWNWQMKNPFGYRNKDQYYSENEQVEHKNLIIRGLDE